MLEARESDRFERGSDAARHLLALHPDLLHRERDFMRDVGRKELRLEILKDHPDHRGATSHTRAPSSERPPIRTTPAKTPSSNSGTIRLRHFASVDLPAPDAPMTPTISPAAPRSRTPLSAARSPPV